MFVFRAVLEQLVMKALSVSIIQRRGVFPDLHVYGERGQLCEEPVEVTLFFFDLTLLGSV